MASMICCFVFVIFVSQTTASHFRGGIITWRPDEYIGNKINFNFRLGFRRSSSNSYFCDSAMVAQQRIVGSGGVWSASHDRGHYGSRTVADTGYHCTDFSVSEDWTQGENTFNYTFPDDGPWLVSYSGCCWISLANGSRSWFLSTTVNLTRRQDNGKINSSPISALSPIVRHQQGCSKTIFIPAEDSDGDKVRCRWSAGSQRECGGVCQRFSSSGTLDEEKCTLRLHSNAALGWHAVAITLEDFPASTTNFHTATPFSHVSLQFLVHVSSSSGPCNRAPLLIGQSPNDGSCEEVPDGGIFYSIIEAKHIDSSRRIAEIITVTPLYMRLTNLLNYTDNVGDNVYYKNVSWSPKSSQKGRHIFCFKAIDYHGVESDQRCITILVGTSNTPRPILSTRTPLIPTLYWPWGSKSVDFNITFDQQIKRPRHSKFIRIILQGHVIYKLDTRSSSDVSIDQNGFTLRFSVPQVVMSMRGNYSVTMDRGAVVGLGCTSDGPPTPGIGSTTSWPFSVGVCSQGTFIADGYNCDDVDECSNPPSIVSRKKRNIWYWPYRSATPLLPGSSASIASAVSVSGSCPYYMNGKLNGRFTSPNYPSYYGNYDRCSLLIEAPHGHHIYLQFRSFSLESGGAHCPYDYVEIFDGNSILSFKITRACGPQQNAPCEIYSSGRFLYVKFSSDSSGRFPGFSAYYYALSNSQNVQQVMGPIVISSCNSVTSPLISSTRGMTPTLSLTQASSAAITSAASLSGSSASIASAVSVSGSCPYYMNGKLNGRFTSPNYPSYYGNYDRCSLLIEAPHGHHIYLQFRSFSLESGGAHCPYDYVEIFDGNSILSFKITRACGPQQNAPCEIYSSGRFLYVKFSSDSSGRFPGFSAYYYALSNSQNVQQVMGPIVISSCNSVTSPLISSTRGMTPTLSLTQGWMKYSQNTTWCTFAGRSLISSYVNIIQCQRYCEARVGCNAIEYWEGRHGYSICHECTDTSKITPYNNENDSGYPVYVWIKIGFTRPLPASFAIQSTAAIYSPPNLLTSSPTASSAAITSAASLSGWMKYSQNTTWCTFAGRSFISSYVNIIQCQRYCEARVGCNAIEYWEGRERYCYECTDTSKITSYNNAYAWAYPVYVWIKIGFTRPLPASFAIQSTAAIYSPPNLLPSSPTASSAAITSAASLSGWMKYSQNTTWCTFAGRSFISSYVNIIQCQRYCEARVGCNAIEYWEGRERYCYECTDTSKITSYNNAYAWAYPVYVWIKIGFTRPLPASFAIQSTAAIYSPPNLLTSSPTESLSRKSFTTTPLPAVSSATYASPYLFKSSPTSEFLKESLKGSVDIQASTAMVIPTASRVPFVLHLPANCQHNCVNTWGSFYCRCRQGYKLQADGKTCEDINECETQNGGCTHQCTNTPGSHYCKCREGTTMSIDNKTCHEPGINVRCTDNAMSISLERKSFKGFNPNTLTLLYSSCRASYNDTHITLRTSLNDCGTTHNESEDAITFYNEVRSVQFSPGTVITREQNVSIPFYCSFGRKAIVRNPSFKTWKNYVTSAEGGYGNFTFTMDMFKTSNYYSPYGYNDYPITVNLQDRLFLQIAVKSHQSNLVVFVDTCRATPSTDPYAVPQYIFIQRGCGLDSTLNYSYSINSKQRFSIQAFLFIQDHPVVHFHCEVLACHRNTARSRCLQGCSRSRGRRDEDPGSESTQVYEMSSGPIKFQKTNPGKMDKSTDVQTNMGLVTGVAAAGGIFLFLAIALAVAVVLVKKRFKGALADRNRAYAMEQFSKYVKEEKDNDGFSQDDDVNESGEQNFNKNAST
ncbi:uncharacterized protein LOC114949673 isoform X3 [Acropora millepora]|uniref:uncharacterized protein LOC114949673 isoform X3 n=1 Tax=Acropora millepora TaxID=45264 RepID=UPI001CF2B4BD|nr:uncharacterized protein LOC114949673 isoform X3 [Acropora millepora]